MQIMQIMQFVREQTKTFAAKHKKEAPKGRTVPGRAEVLL